MQMGINMKTFVKRHFPILLLVGYGIFYMTWFALLEHNVVKNYKLIHMKIDDYIPFSEVFVIPYFLWFVYLAAVILYLLIYDKTEYYKCCLFIFIGMTVFLIISTLFPNGHNLRMTTFPRDNIFTDLIGFLYKIDSSTNIVPSIHVYNSIGAHIAISRTSKLSSKRYVQTGSFILSFSIILSTVMIKQHSMFDVIMAFLMAMVMYSIVYLPAYSSEENRSFGRNTQI